MRRTANENHALCAVSDEKKHVQGLHGKRFDRKEIARQELPWRDRSGAGGMLWHSNTVRIVVAPTSIPNLRSSPSNLP
jgi:hypothetical protein